MVYIKFERGGPKFLNVPTRVSTQGTAVRQRQLGTKMATMQHKILCVREFIKAESATAVHSAFRLRFNIQPPNEEEHLSLESPI